MLNRIPLNASLHPGRTNDIVACQEQLTLLTEEDIVIADRGYDSYAFFAAIMEKKAHFVIRCRSNRKICRELLSDQKLKEQTNTLKAPELSKDSIPPTLTLRFVRIPLPNGEVEILATSLLDKKRFPYKDFKKLYAQRWKIETYFQVLKSRLGVENFSGKSKDAILQDLHASVFLSGFATILTEDANEQLGEKGNCKFSQQVNNSVAFHAIKSKIMMLVFDPPPDVEQQIKALFMQSPTLVRTGRKKLRRFDSRTAAGKKRSLFFQKHLRKHVF